MSASAAAASSFIALESGLGFELSVARSTLRTATSAATFAGEAPAEAASAMEFEASERAGWCFVAVITAM